MGVARVGFRTVGMMLILLIVPTSQPTHLPLPIRRLTRAGDGDSSRSGAVAQDARDS